MTTLTVSGFDLKLRTAVMRQLDWDPEVEAAGIGVTTRDGVVTLTGSIDSYTQKLAAERVVKRVRGVRAVANDLSVPAMAGRSDSEIAHDAAQALALRPILADTVQVTVHHAHVTLTGTVPWLYQKGDAEDAVRHIRGVRGVNNHIGIKPASSERDLRRRIVGALHRQADLDARHIHVDASGDTVVLTGAVATWSQRDTAERAAGAAPGIVRVDNQIDVVPVEPVELEPPDELC